MTGDQVPAVRDHPARSGARARGIIPMLMGGEEADVFQEDVDTLGESA
ncbi:hypothetical protein [Streptomyces sp. NPDC003023]